MFCYEGCLPFHLQQPPVEASRDLKQVMDSPRVHLGDYRDFYETLKAVYGPTQWVQSPLWHADGRVCFTDKASFLSRWSAITLDFRP